MFKSRIEEKDTIKTNITNDFNTQLPSSSCSSSLSSTNKIMAEMEYINKEKMEKIEKIKEDKLIELKLPTNINELEMMVAIKYFEKLKFHLHIQKCVEAGESYLQTPLENTIDYKLVKALNFFYPNSTTVYKHNIGDKRVMRFVLCKKSTPEYICQGGCVKEIIE